MDIVPFYSAIGDSDGQRSEAAANREFLQLFQENRLNVFLQDHARGLSSKQNDVTSCIRA